MFVKALTFSITLFIIYDISNKIKTILLRKTSTLHPASLKPFPRRLFSYIISPKSSITFKIDYDIRSFFAHKNLTHPSLL